MTPNAETNVEQILDGIKKRFFAKVDKNGELPKSCPELGKCWKWKGCKNLTGYATMNVGFWKEQKANRVSWRIHFGDFDRKLYVLHKCDNRECCNPDHLYLGDQFQNMKDMFDRERTDRKGEENGRAKLTEEIVREIKRKLEAGCNQDQLAKSLGVSGGTIGFIKRGETWSWVKC